MTRTRKVLDANLVGKKAEGLDRSLRKLIVGQQEAIEQVVKVYQTYLAGMNTPDRPVGNFPVPWAHGHRQDPDGGGDGGVPGGLPARGYRD